MPKFLAMRYDAPTVAAARANARSDEGVVHRGGHDVPCSDGPAVFGLITVYNSGEVRNARFNLRNLTHLSGGCVALSRRRARDGRDVRAHCLRG